MIVHGTIYLFLEKSNDCLVRSETLIYSGKCGIILNDNLERDFKRTFLEIA